MNGWSVPFTEDTAKDVHWDWTWNHIVLQKTATQPCPDSMILHGNIYTWRGLMLTLHYVGYKVNIFLYINYSKFI